MPDAQKKSKCDEYTCRHYAGYEDITGSKWCACHWVGREDNWPDGIFCVDQPPPSPTYE